MSRDYDWEDASGGARIIVAALADVVAALHELTEAVKALQPVTREEGT